MFEGEEGSAGKASFCIRKGGVMSECECGQHWEGGPVCPEAGLALESSNG